jgi:tRNA(Ile)-lysidine synthase
MAQRCADTASKLGITHVTTSIPWSSPPFPSSPASGGTLELTAREARYHLLRAELHNAGAEAIAFGHHADDQVETVLMRLGRGGSGGMRHVRRWGMGFGDGPGALGWAGVDGMSRWIIRPLLSVGKVGLNIW